MANYVVYTRGNEVAKLGKGNLTFEWNISEFGERMKSAKPGEFVKLDDVQVGGTTWYFKVEPNGKVGLDANVSIKCYSDNMNPETVKVSFSAMENGTNVYKSREFIHTYRERKLGYGYPRFLTHDEIKQNDGILSGRNLLLIIKVTLLSSDNNSIVDNNSIISMEIKEKLKISEDLREVWHSDDFSDVHIMCAGEVFYCHRVILSNRSEYFRNMLKSDFTESRIKIIEMKEIDVETLKAILKFIYGGKIDKLDEHAVNLLEASQMLQLDDLKNVSEIYLLNNHMSLENVIDMLVLADTHSASDLKKGALEIIVKNSAAIIKQVGWKEKLIRFPVLLLEVFEALADK